MEWSEFCRIGNTRTTRRADHALIAPDGHVIAPLPAWGGAPGIVLISPVMGARLAQSLVLLEADHAVTLKSSPDIERFVYVLEGSLDWGAEQRIKMVDGRPFAVPPESGVAPVAMNAGHFVFLPPGDSEQFIKSHMPSRLLVFEKRYEPRPGVLLPKRIIGHESQFEGKPFMGDPDAVLKVLLPENPSFDMAVNIFTYQPGATLPFVETHIMEHGLMMIQGGGIYRLGDSWYPVLAGDCIWMAPYCPQWFAATGKTAASYIYYKDVNRNAL